MLPEYYKFSLLNESNVTIGSGDVDLVISPCKFDSNGAVSRATDVTRTNASSISDDAQDDIGSSIDNTSTKATWADVELKVTTPSSGTVQEQVTLFLHRSLDDTDFSDDDTAEPVAVIAVDTTSTTYTKVITIS